METEDQKLLTDSANANEQPSSQKIFYLGCALFTVGGVGAPITFINKIPGVEVFAVAAMVGLSLLCMSHCFMESEERAEICSSVCCRK